MCINCKASRITRTMIKLFCCEHRLTHRFRQVSEQHRFSANRFIANGDHKKATIDSVSLHCCDPITKAINAKNLHYNVPIEPWAASGCDAINDWRFVFLSELRSERDTEFYNYQLLVSVARITHRTPKILQRYSLWWHHFSQFSILKSNEQNINYLLSSTLHTYLFNQALCQFNQYHQCNVCPGQSRPMNGHVRAFYFCFVSEKKHKEKQNDEEKD